MVRYDEGNFFPVKWADVKEGDTVWLKGSHMGLPVFYGPHTVNDTKKRELKNGKDVCFLEYPEDLHQERKKDGE